MKIQLGLHSTFFSRKNAFFVMFLVILFGFSLTQTSIVSAEEPGIVEKFGNSIGQGAANSASASIGDKVSNSFKEIAIAVLTAEAALANAAAGLFAYILNPVSFSTIMNNAVVYEIWKIVRDTTNMIFILVLLFSAFATIYQIDKYKYNKILWTVIIMALLVNFSWPIGRTIIDFFNSMMYFFVDSIFKTSGQQAARDILGSAQLKDIFLPDGVKSDWPPILLAIIVMFIFMMTLLVLALMLLIRLVALPVLMMFAPIGFAGMAAPFTQGYAKKWWSKLFQYASFGPMAVFMVLVSVRVLQKTQDWKAGMTTTMAGMSAPTGPVSGDVLTSLVYFAIPIVLFWMAITSAEKMSGELSSGATKLGISLGKWAGRQPWRGVKGVSRGVGLTGGVQQAWKNRQTALLGGANAQRAREAREDSIARQIGAFGSTSGRGVGAENARKDAFNKEVAAEQEKLKRLGNVTQAKSLLEKGSIAQKKAAALYLSEKEALTGAGEFQMALKAVGKDLSAARGIISKAPKTVLTNAKELTNSLQILSDSGQQRLHAELVAKAEKGALGANGGEYDAIIQTLSTRDAQGNVTIDPDLKRTYDKRLTEQGQAHIRVESSVAKLRDAGPVTPDVIKKAYADVFNTINANDLTKQDETMLTGQDFKAYFQAKKQGVKKEILAAMSRENKENIVTALTSP